VARLAGYDMNYKSAGDITDEGRGHSDLRRDFYDRIDHFGLQWPCLTKSPGTPIPHREVSCGLGKFSRRISPFRGTAG
jgi:predicted molibdopterin-dependent oxidoreductase YjgC